MKKLLMLLVLIIAMLVMNASAEVYQNYEYDLAEDGGAEIIAYIGECGAELIVPEQLSGLPVTSIGDYAFAYQNMRSAVLPRGLQHIGVCAFNGCYLLESLSLAEGLMEIGADAFLCCEKLASLCLPSTVKVIGDEAFYNCLSLQSVVLPEGVQCGSRAFDDTVCLIYYSTQ